MRSNDCTQCVAHRTQITLLANIIIDPNRTTEEEERKKQFSRYLFETRKAMELFIHENYCDLFFESFVLFVLFIWFRDAILGKMTYILYVKLWITQVLFLSCSCFFVMRCYKSERMQFHRKIATIQPFHIIKAVHCPVQQYLFLALCIIIFVLFFLVRPRNFHSNAMYEVFFYMVDIMIQFCAGKY